MAFVQDLTIGSINSSLLQQSIIHTANSMGIEENRALFLLILCDWKEEKVIADLAVNPRLANVFRRSVPEHDLQTRNEICSICEQPVLCNVLDCNHFVCTNCFQDYVEANMGTGGLLLVCPNEGCQKFVNPRMLESLTQETQVGYTNLLLQDFILKTMDPNPFVRFKKGFEFLWNNRTTLVTTGFVGLGAFGTHKVMEWRQKNPQTWNDLKIFLRKLIQGGRPCQVRFWVAIWLEGNFGIRR